MTLVTCCPIPALFGNLYLS
uniref:Uncharacterized protein n=1 Tax=Anguilla anguilla TaxID=7936 RepID=A0A0E9XYU2_ANGAN